jgi:Flp pilus assembly protein TadG
MTRTRSRAARGAIGARRTRATDRGSASVEFALVLPLVLTMALVVLQVGLLVKDQLVVEEAARAGARQAAVSADDRSAQQAAVDAAGSLDPNVIAVDVSRAGGAGTPVAVTVVYRAPIAIAIVRWLLPSEVDLSAQASMRQETG